VHGLRASATTLNDLANGIAAIGLQLTSEGSPGPVPSIEVAVDGESRDLNPIVREEAFRIAGEALRNAIKHAHAQHIGVTIHYERRQLRLVIRDDGKGIDAETMARQQAVGHFDAGHARASAIVNGRLDVKARSVPAPDRLRASNCIRASAHRRWWQCGRIHGHR
jgi:signal transduction histidine kinase